MTPTMHIPTTGKHVTVTAISIGHYVEGKAIEMCMQGDDLGLYQQLGLIPMAHPVG